MVEVADMLLLFGLQAGDFSVEQIGSGHIHLTYSVKGSNSFIFQRVNRNVFKQPDLIASNLRCASDFLKSKYPNYSFLSCVRSLTDKDMEYDSKGYPWRLFPYIKNTVTVDSVTSADEAYQAAAEFGRLTRFLDGIDTKKFQPTIPRFHDLVLRKEQFELALSQAGTKAAGARQLIDACKDSYHLVDQYQQLISSGDLKERIVHNDTKINNVLFDRNSGRTVGAIDLDTLMPGYFIYDLGDMVRTFVCPVSEEEKDLNLIAFRKNIYEALLSGYLSEMNGVLTPAEHKAIPFAGKMMTFIMALRFLADYLRGNTYYHITYPEQNLVRAANQLRLLKMISENVKG
jgi:Ser/Thr protein kinase RdoA (MazF antagonist)